MASARASALQQRRSSVSFGNKIKILAPQDTGISSIAKQNAANETDVMITKYNNGEIGNEEMKTFFTKQLSNPYVTASDKSSIQTKLADFDVLIEKDRLESVFKQAPDNSLAKSQAAQALADFYTKRASTMVAGTPAHSQALENAGIWKQNVANIQESTNKIQRKNIQNQMLEEINKLPKNSAEKASARAEMYKKLYDLAVTQGDTEDAQVYAANMEQENTNAQAYAQQESEQSQREQLQTQKKNIVDTINTTLNDYHDGKLNEQQVLQVFGELDPYVTQLGDTSLMLSFNRNIDTVQKNLEKGGLRRTTTASGLTAVIGKGGTGADVTVVDKEKQDFSDNMRLIQEMYIVGKDMGGNPYTEADYKEDMKETVKSWQEKLTLFDDEVKQLASENPNQKIWWQGHKTRVADVVDEIKKEADKVNGMDQAIDNNSLLLVEMKPSSIIGKNNPQFELRDTNNLSEQEQNLIAVDENGIGHIGYLGKERIEQNDYDLLDPTQRYRDPKTGFLYKYAGLKYDVYDPETGNKYTQGIGPNGLIASYNALNLAEKYPEEIKQIGWNPGDRIEFNPEKAAKINEQQTQMSAEEVRKSQERAKKIQEVGQKPVVTEKPLVQKIQETAQGILPTVQKAPIPVLAEKATQIAQPAVKAVESTAQGIQKSVADQLSDITPKIQSTATALAPVVKKAAETVSTTSPISYAAPKIATAIQPVVQAAKSYSPTETFKSNVQQAAKAVQSYNPVQTFSSNVQQAKNVVQNIGTTVKNTVSDLWNKLKWW